MVDSTGGRRFWPVKVRTIDMARMKDGRNQLWAEAVARYDRGETWWPDEAKVGMFEAEQEARYDVDAWEESISKYVEGRATVTAEQLLTICLGIEMGKVTRADQTRVGCSMRRLGWGKVRRRVGGVVTGIYIKPGEKWDPGVQPDGVVQGEKAGSDWND